MTNMYLSMKQKQTHREQTGGGHGGDLWGRDGVGGWG